jgi:hypothetical protein
LERPTWAPGEIDLERPSAARVYDYYLGGSHNFAVDRAMAQEALRIMPDMPQIMQANRAFLRRSVRYLVERGIDQFIDIGSGIPTVGNVHEVAQDANPDARVLYVDMDPVAVAHSRAILAGNPNAGIVQADVRRPDELFHSDQLARLIDPDRPVGVLMMALLHFIDDADDPDGLVAGLRDRVPEGSYLALSHACHGGQPEKTAAIEALYSRSPNPMTFRSQPRVEEFFKGFSLVDPGVVYLTMWRPDPTAPADPHAERISGFGGVGLKQ